MIIEIGLALFRVDASDVLLIHGIADHYVSISHGKQLCFWQKVTIDVSVCGCQTLDMQNQFV